MPHDDVAAVADVTAAGQAEQFPTVQFPVRMIFDILHTCARIPEPRTVDEPDKAVVPARFPFPVHKDPKAVLKTESLEASGAALVFEHTCHGGKPQLAEFVERRLYGHAWTSPFSRAARRVRPWLPVVRGGIPLFTLFCPFWRMVVIFSGLGYKNVLWRKRPPPCPV